MARWSELTDGMRTGDILLFSGRDAAARVVEFFTGGPYSHVAMVYRPRPDQPPLLWEAVSYAAGIDVITQREQHDPHADPSHDGAQLGDALEFVKHQFDQGDRAYYRPLLWDRPDGLDDQMMRIMTELDDRKWGSPFTMAGDWIEGHFIERDSGNVHMFCSQLIAATFQQVGLVDTAHPPNYYSPSNFSEHDEIELQLGAQLGPTVEFTLS